MPRRNGPRQQAQIGFDEERLDDATLLASLEDWQEAKDELKPYRLAFREINRTTKALIDQKELADGTYRCGRFIITLKEAEETHIEFDRASKRTPRIKLAK